MILGRLGRVGGDGACASSAASTAALLDQALDAGELGLAVGLGREGLGAGVLLGAERRPPWCRARWRPARPRRPRRRARRGGRDAAAPGARGRRRGRSSPVPQECVTAPRRAAHVIRAVGFMAVPSSSSRGTLAAPALPPRPRRAASAASSGGRPADLEVHDPSDPAGIWRREPGPGASAQRRRIILTDRGTDMKEIS